MDIELRETIRNMPYRKRNHGLSAAEVYDLGLLIKFINFLIRFADYIPIAPLRNLVLMFTMMMSFVVLNVLCVQSSEVNKVNSANKNRTFDSFTDEECWHNLRFRRHELIYLFELSGFPAVVTCTNGLSCPGEHAFMLMLYRLAYPCRLFTLQDIFGREYTQLSRIFKFAINFMYVNHKHKVHGNLEWYSDRFDMYHEAVVRKIMKCPKNPNIGNVPIEVSNVFAFIDGTGLEIARPSNGAQNPFYNGYMHGHYLIFQGISFPDGLLVIEGAFPGYQPDTMVWRDSVMRHELERIMVERTAEGRHRYKLYADKIYQNNALITAAYNVRNNPAGLTQWQIELNRLMSDIRVAVEWSFGKVVERNKFVSFGKSMKIQGSPVSKYYHVAILLANSHTCMYGCQHTRYFNILPPSIEEYYAQEEQIHN